ncbi:MAG: AMP-binding protein [Oscillospiraceae bacterium]|nr:AMP-binding protein [Oscillospiraceae bacterium]
MHLNERIWLSLKNNPSQIAIVYNGEDLTYSHLVVWIMQFLQNINVSNKSEDLYRYIFIYVSSPLEGLIAHLAALLYGAICVPLNKNTPIAYYVLNRIDDTACIITDDIEVEHLIDIPVIFVPKDSEYLRTSKTELCDYVLERCNDHSHCIMTSGSTGTPKAVLLNQKAILNQVDAKIELLKMNSDSRVCISMNSSFVASIWQIFATLFVGGTLVVLNESEKHNPYEIFKKADENRCTVLCVVPSVLRAFLLANVGARKLALKNLTSIVLTGELLHSDIVRQFYNEYDITLINAYGQTETSDDTFHFVIPKGFDCNKCPIVPIGYPINVIDYSIVDENGNVVADGESGELCIAGVCLAAKYLWDEEQTKQAFKSTGDSDSNITFFTGDIVSQCDDGALICHGRKDNQVKINGYRIEPEALEACCLSLEGVFDALAFKIETPTGEHIVLRYVSDVERNISEDDIRAHLAARLPSYMLPSVIEEIDSIAYNNNGKKIRDASKLSPQEHDSSNQDKNHDIVHEAIKKVIHEIAGSNVQEDIYFTNLNSLEYITLLVELEEALDIKFCDEELRVGTFSSLDELINSITELTKDKEQTA